MVFGVSLHPYNYVGDTYAEEFCNGIETMTGHTGATTKALHLCISKAPAGECCIQTAVESQTLRTPVHGYYLRFWAKLPSSLGRQIANGHYSFQSLGAYKTQFDHRGEWAINGGAATSNGGSWHYSEDNGGLSCTGTSGLYPRGIIDPNTGLLVTATCAGSAPDLFGFDSFDNTGVPVPIDEWFLMEVYINRSIGNDGRFFWAVDGKTLVDAKGPSYGAALNEVKNFYNITHYIGYFDQANLPASLWVDDILWRDRAPCATLPCGANGTGVISPVASPPDVTNAHGTIGTVGVPLRYQITATNSPTSFKSGVLPAGLSLNTSSGVISGTPTTAGRIVGLLEGVNNSGKGYKSFVWQINSAASSRPTLSSFTAAPSSINAGQWTQLRWIQSGATTLSINGVNVTGHDPYPVNPGVTTTYILTAKNSIGSTSLDVTVNVK